MQMTGSVMRYRAVRSDGLVFDDVPFTNEGRAVQYSPAFPMRDESIKIMYDASHGPIFYSSPVYL